MYILDGSSTCSSPYTVAKVLEGILFTRSVALPLTSRTANLWKRCRMAYIQPSLLS